MPPTCGQVKAMNALGLVKNKYQYCAYEKGLPTSTKEFAYWDQWGVLTGSYVQAPTILKYLWEVIEIDKPMTQDRPIGTIVESIATNA